MRCTVCGARLRAVVTDLPFKVAERTVLIVKSLPVLQCEGCQEYLIEDAVMQRVDALLAGVGAEAELEVVRFAA